MIIDRIAISMMILAVCIVTYMKSNRSIWTVSPFYISLYLSLPFSLSVAAISKKKIPFFCAEIIQLARETFSLDMLYIFLFDGVIFVLWLISRSGRKGPGERKRQSVRTVIALITFEQMIFVSLVKYYILRNG